MAVYAIGDVQGCFEALTALLKKISFNPARDALWFTGDLVNRGPDSLETLRFVKNLRDRAVTVLGNHDLHCLAVAAGTAKQKKLDTLGTLLNAPDRTELLDWLRTRPLLHHDPAVGYALVHAGFLPPWNLTQAKMLAREVEAVLRADDYKKFFEHMYGNFPDHWRDDLAGLDRLRVIVNAFTRLRYCDLEGAMDLHQKAAPGEQPPDLMPWFRAPRRQSANDKIVFGHWSTLGIYEGENVVGLDSGCLWGGQLTAARLHPSPLTFYSVECPRRHAPHHDG
jgi:bis(5'-nucleosyl)-tetraphosphatase (symmetrical)